jgi:hypothetical protein
MKNMKFQERHAFPQRYQPVGSATNKLVNLPMRLALWLQQRTTSMSARAKHVALFSYTIVSLSLVSLAVSRSWKTTTSDLIDVHSISFISPIPDSKLSPTTSADEVPVLLERLEQFQKQLDSLKQTRSGSRLSDSFLMQDLKAHTSNSHNHKSDFHGKQNDIPIK